MRNILITGGNGYIGRSLYNSLKECYNVVSISRKDFDLVSREDTTKFFQDKHFDVVIHTAIKGGSRLHQDPLEVTHTNLSMFYNLLANKQHYTKLINIGSGAEVGYPSDPYGLSKSIIATLVDNECYFYNVRVFAVFNEDELDTRFIKANIQRYINRQPLEINQDKFMDFFYMEDFINVVKFYIDRNHKLESPAKLINCCYEQHPTLSKIADMINSLDTHKVPVYIKNTSTGIPYVGEYNTPQIEGLNIPSIKYIGLEQGITNTYNKLKK